MKKSVGSNSHIRNLSLFLALAFLACNVQEDTLAPYLGATPMGNILVQDSTLSPRVYWNGGYVSVFGVNAGAVAALDSTLVFLVHAAGNSVRYPVTVGQIPPGASNIAPTYGGTSVTKLVEDAVYTFWVMKEDAWSQIVSQRGKRIRPDANATGAVRVVGDTVFTNTILHTQHTQAADAFVNIRNLDPRGRLADLWVQQTDTSNNAVLTFTVKQPGVTSPMVAAMGLVVGSGTYLVDNVVWEVLSVDASGPKPVYRTKDVIASPVLLGESLPQTEAFKSFPLSGLERGRAYYVWVASKDWDGLSRDSRTVPYYSWITFTTW